jgi:2-polyprenyl-6-hydroxyphenyl methylase/3-demethylubiquinone-9 3-methyltransferase
LLGIILCEKTAADAFGFSVVANGAWRPSLEVVKAGMKRVYIEDSWPETWKWSYSFDLQEIYGEIRHHGHTYAYANRFKRTIGLIEESVPKGAKILDVAAGQGNFSLVLAERGYDVTWNDLRADLEGYVELKREKGVVHYAPGNAFDLGFDGQFDCVLIAEVIEHVAHPDQFLQKIAGMVKPGGYVVMSTPNGRYFLNKLPKFSDCADPSMFESVQFKPNGDGHIFLIWPDEIVPLGASAGLILEKHECFTNPLTHGHIKTELALRLLPRGAVEALEGLSNNFPRVVKEKLTTNSCSRYRKPL